MEKDKQITGTCKDCEYWKPFENDPEKGTCTHPERHDRRVVYHYNYIKASDYCTKISKKKD